MVRRSDSDLDLRLAVDLAESLVRWTVGERPADLGSVVIVAMIVDAIALSKKARA